MSLPFVFGHFGLGPFFLPRSVHYLTFYYVEDSTLVVESLIQSADFGQSMLTVLRENHIMYNGHSLFILASDYESSQTSHVEY